MRIAVVGLGKIGLPLAVQFARKGHSVVGADIDARTVKMVQAGLEPFPNEAHLAEYLAREVDGKRLKATRNVSDAVNQAQVVVVVVPLVVNAEFEPDFAAMDDATTQVARGLAPGTLVSFETTVPVGTTRNRLLPILESESGLTLDQDFHLVFSPERVLTGRVFSDLRRYPKLVGGASVESEQRGADFYRQVLDFDERPDLPRENGVWEMGSTESAEFAKLAETTYRDVNIGLANQFALFAEKNGMDVTRVIEACNSQPYSHIHSPGIAVGGHCIPVYPRLYLWTDDQATIVSAARIANAQMPERVVDRAGQELGTLTGKRVVVLGAAYRSGVKEIAFSGVFPTVRALERHQAIPLVHDPLYSEVELRNLGFEPYTKGEPVDVVILQADHHEYQQWTHKDCPGVELVMDGRSVLPPDNWQPNCRVLRIGSSPIFTQFLD